HWSSVAGCVQKRSNTRHLQRPSTRASTPCTRRHRPLTTFCIELRTAARPHGGEREAQCADAPEEPAHDDGCVLPAEALSESEARPPLLSRLAASAVARL